MKIVTISREFGSGGRELGSRLAKTLNFAYFDKEIIRAIAKEGGLEEEFVEENIDRNFATAYPITFGHSFYFSNTNYQDLAKIKMLEKKIIMGLAAQGKDFVIVGRNSDVLLGEFSPLNIFVYADMEYKIKRCESYMQDGLKYNPKDLKKKIKEIDAERAASRSLLTDSKWGDKSCYDLCINTSAFSIKKIVPVIASFVNVWFTGGEYENSTF